MKTFFAIIIFVSLAFPVFSQTAGAQQRFRNLSDAMEATITRNNNRLANYNQMATGHEGVQGYASFRVRYEILAGALADSDRRLNLLTRGNARTDVIREERNNYENLIRQLQALKSDYDNWLRTVQ